MPSSWPVARVVWPVAEKQDAAHALRRADSRTPVRPNILYTCPKAPMPLPMFSMHFDAQTPILVVNKLQAYQKNRRNYKDPSQDRKSTRLNCSHVDSSY